MLPQSQYEELDFQVLKDRQPETMLCCIDSNYLLTKAEVAAGEKPAAYKTKFKWSASKRDDIDNEGQWGWVACLLACLSACLACLPVGRARLVGPSTRADQVHHDVLALCGVMIRVRFVRTRTSSQAATASARERLPLPQLLLCIPHPHLLYLVPPPQLCICPHLFSFTIVEIV